MRFAMLGRSAKGRLFSREKDSTIATVEHGTLAKPLQLPKAPHNGNVDRGGCQTAATLAA